MKNKKIKKYTELKLVTYTEYQDYLNKINLFKKLGIIKLKQENKKNIDWIT